MGFLRKEQMSMHRWKPLGVATASVLAVIAFGGTSFAGGSLKDDQETTVERGDWFFGYDHVKGADYFITGVVVSINGDMSKDGWVIRSYSSRVDYDLDPGDGRGYQTDAMLGYKFDRNKLNGGIYAGVDWQNYKLKPDDPTDKVRGTEWGFKVAADIETSKDLPYYFGLDGNYSTAFDSYWVRGRAGLNRNHITFGPEAIAMGNDGFEAQRLGAFATFTVKLIPNRPTFDVTFSGGHQFVGDSNSGGRTGGTGGSEGTYGNFVISTTF
jgi:hypothetical protein